MIIRSTLDYLVNEEKESKLSSLIKSKPVQKKIKDASLVIDKSEKIKRQQQEKVIINNIEKKVKPIKKSVIWL